MPRSCMREQKSALGSVNGSTKEHGHDGSPCGIGGLGMARLSLEAPLVSDEAVVRELGQFEINVPVDVATRARAFAEAVKSARERPVPSAPPIKPIEGPDTR